MGLTAMEARRSVPAGGSITIRVVAVYSLGTTRPATRASATATPQASAMTFQRRRKWSMRRTSSKVSGIQTCLWDSVADMGALLSATVALLPLTLAPHLLFYFDITPKIIVLLVGTAMVLPLAFRL